MARTREISFHDRVPVDDVDRALTLAVVAAEAIEGAAALSLAEAPTFDRATRTVEVNCSDRVGRTIAKVVVGLISHAHGSSAVRSGRPGARRW